MRNFMFMKQFIRSICISQLFSLFCGYGFSQELVVNDDEIEIFIKEILEDKRLSYIYSRKGYLFNDFLVSDDEGKVISIYRNNGKIFNGTPLIFLNNRNQKVDSLFFSSWPSPGNPSTFSSLLKIDESLIFTPLRVYPSKLHDLNIKRPAKGYIKDFNSTSQIEFYDFSLENYLLGDFFSYDSKKYLLNSRILKASFQLDSVFLRFSDNKLALYDNTNNKMYVIERNTSNVSIFNFTKTRIINFEIYDNNSIVFVCKNYKTNRFEIWINDLNQDKSLLLYDSFYYIPRVKAIGNLIYFEISAKFADSDYFESILFKITK